MSQKRWLLSPILILFFLSGCVAQGLSPSMIPTGVDPTYSKTLPPSKPSLETPHHIFTPTIPAIQDWPNEAEGAVSSAINLLAIQEKIPISTIKVFDVVAVDWPDSCLGIQEPGVFCAQVVTPGYKVFLTAGTKAYEVHTDSVGTAARLYNMMPFSTLPNLVWEKNGISCQKAIINTDGIAVGDCQSPLVTHDFVNPIRTSQFNDYFEKYQPFNSGTAAGNVIFTGRGSVVATQAEQRSIAEWVNIVFLEQKEGRTDTTWGLAFTWQRNGGIAGFCDSLSAYRDGEVFVTSCKNDTLKNNGKVTMDPERLSQMYQWLDNFEPFELNSTDNATVDSMSTKMSFFGTGHIIATPTDQLGMLSYASQLSFDVR
jgi:hypothetical protein